jgi:hypothetical protein
MAVLPWVLKRERWNGCDLPFMTPKWLTLTTYCLKTGIHELCLTQAWITAAFTNAKSESKPQSHQKKKEREKEVYSNKSNNNVLCLYSES